MNPFRIGAAAAMLQGFGLLCLTVYLGVLFPSAGISSPADLGIPPSTCRWLRRTRAGFTCQPGDLGCWRTRYF